jgi:ribosomal protein S18 acetylase RimI-like enzyme
VLTAEGGDDATARYGDPLLPGLYLAAPYLRLQPDYCTVLCADTEPCGYVVGTADSAAFRQHAEREWFPALRRRYPVPRDDDRSADAALIRSLHGGLEVDPALQPWAAHLHLNLLPAAQGQGWGRRLLTVFLTQVRAAGAAGVHVAVAKSSDRACDFYRRRGFRRYRDAESDWIYVNEL